jgi:hypothetical protein
MPLLEPPFPDDTNDPLVHCIPGLLPIEIQPEIKAMLNNLCNIGMPSTNKEATSKERLPRRLGQQFNGHPMVPFHPGLRTYYDVTAPTGPKGNNHGLCMLFRDSFHEVVDSESTLTKWAADLAETGLACLPVQYNTAGNEIEYTYHYKCHFRVSRFETAVRERTGPVLEMTEIQYRDLVEKGAHCLHFLVPLCEDGLLLRVFKNRHDFRGTILKIMPDTILIYPPTLMMEFGRCTHVRGHRHLLVKIMYSPTLEGQPPVFNLDEATREYPHLPNATADLRKKQTPNELKHWELPIKFHSFPRYVQHSQHPPIDEHTGKWESFQKMEYQFDNPLINPLLHLESDESLCLNELFSC